MADISPAQRIVAAFNERYELCGPFDDDWIERCLAAALRAAADQVVPEDSPSSFMPGAPQAYAIQRRTIRRQLFAIAAQLETTTDTP
jgi:hypothetical protein